VEPQTDRIDPERCGVQATLGWTIDATDKLCDAVHDDYRGPPMAWLHHFVRMIENVDAHSPRERAA
jgi:hypothetical protein